MKTKSLNTQHNSIYGFTLIELLIVLGIFSIVMMTAIPAFSHMIANNQQKAQLYTLYSHHQLARIEAIKRNQRVTLCKSSNGQQCTPESHWHNGWIVFADMDHNNTINDNEHLIFIQHALADNLTLNYNGFGSDNYIIYFSNGLSSTNGTFTLCSQFAEDTAKSVVISRSGRARIDNKDGSGKALKCS